MLYKIKKDIVVGDYTILKGAHIAKPRERFNKKIIILLNVYSKTGKEPKQDNLEPSRFKNIGVENAYDFFKLIKKLNKVVP